MGIDMNDVVAVQSRLQETINHFDINYRGVISGQLRNATDPGLIADLQSRLRNLDTWVTNARRVLDSGNVRGMQQFVENGRFSGPANISFVEYVEKGVENVADIANRVGTATAKTPVLQDAVPVVEETTETVAANEGWLSSIGTTLSNVGNAGLNVLRSSWRTIVDAGRSIWDTLRGNLSTIITGISTAFGLTPAGLLRRTMIGVLVALVAAGGAWWWNNSGEPSGQNSPAVVQPANQNAPPAGEVPGPMPAPPPGEPPPFAPGDQSGGGSGGQPAEPGSGSGGSGSGQGPQQPGGGPVQGGQGPGGQMPSGQCCGDSGGGSGGSGGGGGNPNPGGSGGSGGSQGSGQSFGHIHLSCC